MKTKSKKYIIPIKIFCTRCKTSKSVQDFSKTQLGKYSNTKKCKTCTEVILRKHNKQTPLSYHTPPLYYYERPHHYRYSHSYCDTLLLSTKEKHRFFGIDNNRDDVKQFINALQNDKLTIDMIQYSTFCNLCFENNALLDWCGPKKICQYCKKELQMSDFPTNASIQDICKFYMAVNTLSEMNNNNNNNNVEDFTFFTTPHHLVK